MSDIALTWDPAAGAADIGIASNDLSRDAGLHSAVLLSLYLDRRAEAGDILPDGETDRRGWWADGTPVVDLDAIGSRLWLLAREKATETTRRRAEQFAREALQWLLDDRVASKIEVSASFPRRDVLDLIVTIYRPQGSAITYRFDHVWGAAAEEGSAPAPQPLDLSPSDAIVSAAGADIVTTTGIYLID